MPVKKPAAKKAAATPKPKVAKKTTANARPKVAKKAASSTARKSTAEPHANQNARPEEPQQSSSSSNATDAFMNKVNAFADKATEQATVIGKQVVDAGTKLGKQAEIEIEKGKQFLREHPTEAVLGAALAAGVAGLAAARATYKSVRRR